MSEENVEVTLTFRGDLGQISEFMQRVFGVTTAKPPITPGVVGGTVAMNNVIWQTWSRDELVRLWAEIRNEDARRMMYEIAKSPAPIGYRPSDFGPSLGIDPHSVGGKFASVKFALKRAFSSKPDPRNMDGARWIYMMDPSVAAIIRELAEKEGL